jgi:predicted RNA methylase
VHDRAGECRTAIGIELDPVQVEAASSTVEGLSNTSIIQGDMATLDLRALGVTHAFAFLSPAGNEMLLPVLQQNLDVGARLVTCSFPLLVCM